MTIDNLCKSCINFGCEFQSGIVRTECAFYMPPYIEPDNCGNYVVQVPTAKNDLGVDCISREATINYFNNFRKKISSMPLMDVVDRLKEQPSVTPHKKLAHWIGEEYDGYADGAPVYTSWVCSECGATFMCEDMDFLYCPRCGSVMEV